MSQPTFIKIEIDNSEIERVIHSEIKNKIHEYPLNKIYYDMKDLQEITSFSKGHIMNTFFFDNRFVKIRKKVGAKHVFPVKETNEFLIEWIKEQPSD